MKKPKEKGGQVVPDLHLILGSMYGALHMNVATAPSMVLDGILPQKPNDFTH